MVAGAITGLASIASVCDGVELVKRGVKLRARRGGE